MTAQDKATKLVAIAELILMAEVGTKLTPSERVRIAKRQAIETCNEVLGDMGADRGYAFWVEVKIEINNI